MRHHPLRPRHNLTIPLPLPILSNNPPPQPLRLPPRPLSLEFLDVILETCLRRGVRIEVGDEGVVGEGGVEGLGKAREGEWGGGVEGGQGVAHFLLVVRGDSPDGPYYLVQEWSEY